MVEGWSAWELEKKRKIKNSLFFQVAPGVVFSSTTSVAGVSEAFLEAILSHLGGRSGASWGPPGGLLGASWGPLGSHLGGRLGPLGGLLGFPERFLRPGARNFRWGPPSRPPLGAVSGASWAVFGARLGGLLGRLGAILGASWAVLGRSWGPLGPSWSVGEPKRR